MPHPEDVWLTVILYPQVKTGVLRGESSLMRRLLRTPKDATAVTESVGVCTGGRTGEYECHHGRRYADLKKIKQLRWLSTAVTDVIIYTVNCIFARTFTCGKLTVS